MVKRLPRNLRPTPRNELAAATPYKVSAAAAPASFLMWPLQMSYWGNDIDGDCCSAEEALAKATAAPQTFIPDAVVEAWAGQNGFISGATPTAVMTAMGKAGFGVGSTTYDDGPYTAVDWTNPATLTNAIYTSGPIKLGVAAESFQSGAASSVTPAVSGWCLYGCPGGQTEDHCTSLCGYGSLSDLVALFASHGVTVTPPAGMPTGQCYAMFTWSSIGIIDQQSLLSITLEAWARSPVTSVNQPASQSWWQWLLSWL